VVWKKLYGHGKEAGNRRKQADSATMIHERI
jgi:hypothetical protein